MELGNDMVVIMPLQVLVRGACMTLGYKSNLAANQDAFMPDGSFRTGDIGYIDAKGALWLAGRLKNLIRSGSESVQAAHVQSVLESCPQISSAAVVGIPHERLGQMVAALIVLPPSRYTEPKPGLLLPDQLQALQQQCLQRGLSRFQLPRLVVQQYQQIPSTALGKVNGPAVVSMLHRFRQQQQQMSRL